MDLDEIMLSAFEYTMILAVPITVLTVAALSDEIFFLVKRAVSTNVRRHRSR